MLPDILDKIQECKAHIDSLSIRISGDTKVTAWFRELCSILTELLLAITKHTKCMKPIYDHKMKDNILLYLMQLTAALSLVIKIFLQEHEVGEVISEARHCILKQLSWCLDGLNDMLITGKCQQNEAGSFIKWMDASLDKLAEIDIEKGSDEALKTCKEVKPIVEEVLCHAMSIGQVGLPEDSKIIEGASQTVLETLDTLIKKIEQPDSNTAMVNLFIDCCSDKLCSLERKVNTGVLQLTLQVFSECTKPLETLYEYCFSDSVKIEEKLDALIADFDLHVDRIMQIGLFAVACSTDADRCVKMRSCLASLEAMEGELVPSLTAVSIDKSVHNVNFAIVLKSYWIHQSQMLKELIYLIIDPCAFCQITYDKLKQIVTDISDNIKAESCFKLTEDDIKKFTDKADVLKDMIKIAMTDFPVENMELVNLKYKDFLLVLNEVKMSSKKLLNNTANENNNYSRILKRCKILLGTIKSLLKEMNDMDVTQQNISVLNISTKDTKVLNDNSNSNKGEIAKNSLLERIEDKGKQIIKDRSVLYKTPTKLSIMKKLAHDFDLAKNKEMSLSKYVHLRKLNFCVQKNASNETNLDLQITDILNDLTNLTTSIMQI